jgi:F-type H+-transporting ATPase subunit delta
MAELLTIARPYAEAAFKHACEAQALPSWSQALAQLAGVVSSPAARDIIGNPALSSAQVARLMTEVIGSLDAAQQNFVRLLADNERLAVVSEIATLFEGLRNQHEGVLQAEIVSAFPIDEAQVQSIVGTLAQKYGRNIKPTVSVDSSLIGGVAIRIGDEVIDASVRGKLAQMAGALKA